MESTSVVVITEQDLEDHLEAATARVFSVQVRPPRRAGAEEEGQAVSLGGRRIAYRPMLALASGGRSGPAASQKVSLIESIRDIAPKDTLFTDTENLVLREVRRGLQVFHEVVESYEKASGLTRLEVGEERSKKTETACAAGLFAACAYMVRKLAGHRADEVEGLSFEVSEPASVSLKSKREAGDLLLWYLVEQIREHAREDVGLAKVVLDCARQVAEHLRELSGSLEHLEFYSRYRFRVEADDVVIAGFELDEPSTRSRVEIAVKRPEEVVGNHVAKFEAMRLAQRLVCYDPERQRNPFVDLGGFSFSFLGDGSPGTGKTTLIQMTVSLLDQYCKTLGLPFRYENFSIDQISDYQGRSAQNAKRFCQSVLDPSGIGFGTVDDVDQVCASRDDKHASAGQLEVTAVLMQELAGAETIVRGNATFGLFSNYPEKVDDALRQRTQARFLVDGPQTREDFTDLMYLLLGSSWQLEHGEGYVPFSTQEIRKVIRARYEEHDRPHDPALARLFEEHAKGGEIATWIEFGHYLKALQQHDPRFTGRAVKNIADAVRFRMMDFDLPEDWLERPELFFQKPYETKVAMLEELRGEITPRVVLQEIHRYVDSEARYLSAEAGREVADRTRQLRVEAEAREAFLSEGRG
jgi:hypothetical protein